MSWLAEPLVCPGLFYSTPAQDGFLIRVRTPAGLLNSQQGRAIVALAEQGGSETLQVTNRANLQIRAVSAVRSPEVLQTLQDLGLAARNPNLDHLRNLMTSPTAGIDPQELIDTRSLVQALDAYIQNQPELAELPAKFSIGIDGGGAVGIGSRSEMLWEHRYNEIQLSAVQVKRQPHLPAGVYFRLALAAEKQLCQTPILIAPEDCLSAVAALTTVYLDYVRSHSQTDNQADKKPRMKHLLQDWGVNRYLQQVDRTTSLSMPLLQVKDCPPLLPTCPYSYLGVHPQRQVGLSYIGVSLPLGQLTVAQLLGLVQQSETFGTGHLRLTPWQTALLPDVPDDRVAELLSHLSSLGFSVAVRPDTALVACAGKPGCAASATQTQRHALALAEYLNPRFTLSQPVNIHLTGCSKSCAQASPAEITLLGTAIDYHGETLEGYQIYVGDGEQVFGDPLCDVSFTEMPLLIEQLLHLYQHDRETPDESFGEFIKKKLRTAEIDWIERLRDGVVKE